MNMALTLSEGKSSDIPDQAAKWSEEYLLESAKAFCANHPNATLYKIANVVVTMVLEDD
ncbi:hypothetical protein [Cellvibrio sp. PSBB023]|uniref:hypothetical protein n=1 Tax=Cellvibrio sp. PSBB023 TaxID=1945512 RepID=UPI00143BEE45|nr:hypothetical protein [Cellvibrio sp. PSBB023]